MPSPLGIIHLAKNWFLFYSIGGSPQTPELQVGQLASDGPVVLDLELENEERSLLGFPA